MHMPRHGDKNSTVTCPVPSWLDTGIKSNPPVRVSATELTTVRCAREIHRQFDLPPIQHDPLWQLHGRHLSSDLHADGDACDAPEQPQRADQVCLNL